MEGVGANVVRPEALVGLKLAPFNPSAAPVIDAALRLLRVGLDGPTVLYDLGCGDGRLLIEAAARCGDVTGVGIEYDGALVSRARSRVQEAGFNQRVSIIHGNVLDTDLSAATAIFVYLVPKGMAALAPRLIERIAHNVPVVTYVFSIPGLTPAAVETYKQSTKIFLYTKSSLPPDHR